ncbi:hypothetical protein CY34DRAFT_188154 [Suillus luteus UH-Slu-Lm8-n1]|uniref:Uncharacterized protein n=1 Tax=Suillus luteus UH-Slu-Lm8-n1 TaxID=930992 RepID=A0A0D0AUV7_9AGAM|nr:hypothetical protein CY34DRAFT_188154 [Suillus luteus UH-Slu-Lm8-n1]
MDSCWVYLFPSVIASFISSNRTANYPSFVYLSVTAPVPYYSNFTVRFRDAFTYASQVNTPHHGKIYQPSAARSISLVNLTYQRKYSQTMHSISD